MMMSYTYDAYLLCVYIYIYVCEYFSKYYIYIYIYMLFKIVKEDVYAFIGLRCCMLMHVGIQKSSALL